MSTSTFLRSMREMKEGNHASGFSGRAELRTKTDAGRLRIQNEYRWALRIIYICMFNAHASMSISHSGALRILNCSYNLPRLNYTERLMVERLQVARSSILACAIRMMARTASSREVSIPNYKYDLQHLKYPFFFYDSALRTTSDSLILHLAASVI